MNINTHKENFTNNLRLYYIELYNMKIVGNIAEFADICRIPHNTMGRYLVKGTYPKEPNRIRDIERILNKDEGDMDILRPTADFNPDIMSWGQPKQRGRKKMYYRESEMDSSLFVAEETPNVIERITNYNKDELHAFLQNLREELRLYSNKNNIKDFPCIYELVCGY